jgi:esterase
MLSQDYTLRRRMAAGGTYMLLSHVRSLLVGALLVAFGGPPVVPLGHAQNPPAQATDRFITLNGLRLHYLDWGGAGKPPLIMLHGIGRVAHTFDHIAPRFTEQYHVIAIDMRGHGDSDWHPGGAYLVEDYVKDLQEFVSQLGLRSLTLWGNSTGGRVVQVYAGLDPDLASALIVEDVGPERPKNIADNFARGVQADAKGWSSEEELLAQLKAGNGGVSEDQLRTYAHFATKRTAEGRIVWKRDPNLAKGFIETELWQYVRRITSPTIYVIGGRSTIVPVETQEQLRKTIPGVEIVTMPGLGHYPSQEAPEEFTGIVKRFLVRVRLK